MQRVEELEDLVIELKSKQSAADVAELRELASHLQLDNLNNLQKISILKEKRINSDALFKENEMHQSYLEIMKEREKVIENLYAQIKKLNNKQVLRVQEQSFGPKEQSTTSQKFE